MHNHVLKRVMGAISCRLPSVLLSNLGFWRTSVPEMYSWRWKKLTAGIQRVSISGVTASYDPSPEWTHLYQKKPHGVLTQVAKFGVQVVRVL